MFLSKKKDYFALSFSDHRIRLAQAGRGGKLRSYFEVKLGPGIVSRGEIKDKEKLQQAVLALVKTSKIKHKFVVVGLPEVKAFTKTFSLPEMEVEELDDAVRWESEPLLPFSLDKAYLDWMVLEKMKDSVRLLVVALPQVLVEEYAKALEEIDFQPLAFETTSLSLARLVERDKSATLVIDVNEGESVLAIVGPRGGIEVSSTVSYRSEDEAADEIAETVGNVLNFYRKRVDSNHSTKKITRLLFSGERLRADLIKRIEKETGIAGSLVAKNEKDLALATMVSLAQKDVAAPIDEKTINLIPPRIQGLYDQTAKVNEISLNLKISLLSLFLIMFGYGVAAANVYFEMKKLEGEIIDLQAGMSMEAKQIEGQARSLNMKSQKIIQLSGSKEGVMTVFQLVNELSSEALVIDHFAYDENSGAFLLDGMANTRADLLSFRQTLETTGRFSRVHFPLSILEKEENVHFTVTLVSKKES